MSKIWAIAWKELYTTFTDRNTLLIMILTPIVLSTIIGLAFGGGGSNGGTISTISVVIVNQDTGTDNEFQPFAFGDQLVNIFIPPEDSEDANTNALGDFTCELEGDQSDTADNGFNQSLEDIVSASLVDTPELARSAVESGEATVAIIIPPDFSQSLSFTDSLFNFNNDDDDPPEVQTAEVEIYANSASPISGIVVRSIVEGILNGFATGSVTVNATLQTILSDPTLLPDLATMDTDTFSPIACALTGSLDTIRIDRVPVNDVQARSAFVQIMTSIGAAQMVFFALFTGSYGIFSIIEEREEWTLQRMLMTPTPRANILLGKILGNLFTVFMQMAILAIALLAVASLIEGELIMLWGTNIIGVIAILIALSICVSGIGIIVVGIARNIQQVNILAPMVNMAFGVLGGAFGFTLPVIVAQFSLIYWGRDSLLKLANGNNDILLHLIVLVIQGIIFFGIGTWLFNRRVEV